jgi:hypothetical protein
MRAALLLGSAAVLWIAGTAHAQVTCPYSTYFFPRPYAGAPDEGGQSTDPLFTATGSYGQWNINANHTTGVFSSGVIGGQCYQQCSGEAFAIYARLVDTYTLVGPGTDPVSITPTVGAQLSVPIGCGFDPYIGTFCCGGAGTVRLVYEARDSTQLAGSAGGTGKAILASQDLPLTISPTPGVPFYLTIVFDIGGSCRSGAQASAALRFDNVPPGYTIQSCKGYTQGQPVPVRQASWGSLKLHYR